MAHTPNPEDHDPRVPNGQIDNEITEEERQRLINEIGAAGNNSQELASSPLGTLGSRMMIADQLYPKEKVDPAMAAFLYFNNMARAASQPGATVVGSAAQAFEDPAKYLMQVKQDNRAMELAKAKAVLGTGSSTGVSGSNVQSRTVYGNGTIQLVLKDGTIVVKEKGSNTIVPQDKIEEVMNEAVQSGVVQAGLEAFATGQAKQSVNMSGKALESTTKISANIRNLEKARDAIERGAGTGFIESMLPDFTAASIELSNIRSQLGLDVVGSVTFGALSKGELDLALSTALPTNLSEEDLIDLVNRKIIAQTKLRDYFQKQALYLGTPGNTVAGWLNQQLEETATNAAFTLQQIKDMSDDEIKAITPDQIQTLSNESLREYTKRRNAIR